MLGVKRTKEDVPYFYPYKMTIERARQILGAKAKYLADDELKKLIDFLNLVADSAMETYEKKLFGESLTNVN